MMAPAAKRRKIGAEEKYRCVTCDTRRGSKQFPDSNPTSTCDHLIHTCTSCLKKWVHAQIEECIFDEGGGDGDALGVKCPDCDEVMIGSEVELVVSKRILKRYMDGASKCPNRES